VSLGAIKIQPQSTTGERRLKFRAHWFNFYHHVYDEKLESVSVILNLYAAEEKSTDQ